MHTWASPVLMHLGRKPPLHTKELGSTGVFLPELAIGTWQYRNGVEPIRAAIELGLTFIDTAEAYGTERLASQATQGIRNKVFIATKVSPLHFRYRDVLKAADSSLRQLNTDYIDLYQLHWPNYTVPIAETMSAMEKLCDEGKIRFIGVSNFSVRELRQAQAALSKARIVSNQVRYSLIDRTAELGLLQYCQEARVSLLAFSPLGSGFGQIQACDPEDRLGEVAKAVDKTRTQVALNWCLSHAPVIAIFKSERIEHIRENCGASGWQGGPSGTSSRAAPGLPRPAPGHRSAGSAAPPATGCAATSSRTSR